MHKYYKYKKHVKLMLRAGDNAYFTVIDYMKGKELFFLRKQFLPWS